MKTLLEKFDAKTITSAGGILIALVLAYILYGILTNDLTHIGNYIQQTNEVLRKNTAAIEGNTEVLRILERRLK